jgi:hypothetical protein
MGARTAISSSLVGGSTTFLVSSSYLSVSTCSSTSGHRAEVGEKGRDRREGREGRGKKGEKRRREWD